MKHTTDNKGFIEVYYDRDYYYCNTEAKFKDCFIGNEEALKALYQDAEYSCIVEDEGTWPYESYKAWKAEMLYAWYGWEVARLSSYKRIYEYYYINESSELKTAMEMYMLWQDIRNVHDYHDTFGAMMNNPQNDHNGMQFYGFDIEPKED